MRKILIIPVLIILAAGLATLLADDLRVQVRVPGENGASSIVWANLHGWEVKPTTNAGEYVVSQIEVTEVHDTYTNVAAWLDAKTNYPTLLKLEARMTNVVASLNPYLQSEGIIATNYTVTCQNTTEYQFSEYLVDMTNITVATTFSTRMQTIWNQIRNITIEGIGKPPDGSTIISHVGE